MAQTHMAKSKSKYTPTTAASKSGERVIYNHGLIESKWQEKWGKEQLYSPDLAASKNKFYNLMMFPYPSAEGLHVGNMYAFTGADVYGRFQRMQGKNVLEPIGLDGFGIHSENYAIKVGRHPKEHAKISEKHFYEQLHQIGNGYDWERTLETYDPDYYRWTQWLFIQMFKAGLAYKDSAMVNWCPSCKTVLSDEQVIAGKCERCGTEVVRRPMSSWFFRITKYADRLLENLKTIDWPTKIKQAQSRWIGKSRGLEIQFALEVSTTRIPVWTKFWETVFGTTFLVVAPEHPILADLKIPSDYKRSVTKYIKDSLDKTEQQRKEEAAEKSGVFTGLYAVNPVNDARVPVWIADYVLMGVGTGAVMGVPAHDERDFAFAKKFDLDIIQVVEYPDPEINAKVAAHEAPHEGEGKLTNSGKFTGLDAWGKGKTSMAEWLVDQGFGAWSTNYHLRDWLISRQRYWGPPIPMVFCRECEAAGRGERTELPGWYTVALSDLPVVLPDIDDFKPKGDGTSPLANAPESWKKAKCPGCGKPAERELDVSDTFLDSAWYFLAYPNLGTAEWKGSTALFNKEITKSWLPVDAYIGGAEHAVLHLLYSRFVTMVLSDLGYLSFEEPFAYFYGHGLIIKDGAKMSKSRGNVVVPDEYIAKYGADTLRMYLMFLGPYDQGGDFRDTGIEGMHRFIRRLWSLFNQVGSAEREVAELTEKMHRTIAKVSQDMAHLRYNTAIAAIMEYVNALREANNYSPSYLRVLALLVAPFAPHMAEEVWCGVLGQAFSVHRGPWPKFDPARLKMDHVTVIVQVNGKMRGQLVVTPTESRSQEAIQSLAEKDERVARWLEGKQYQTIFVAGKLINFVLSS